MTDIYEPAGTKIGLPTSDAEFKVGQCAKGADNTEWVYVQASGSISQYDTVAVDEDYTARAATGTLLGAGHVPAWAQVAFTDDQYGWVAKKGANIQANVTSLASADAALFTTGTAGLLDAGSNTSGNVEIVGVVAVASNDSATGSVEIIANNPHVNL